MVAGDGGARTMIQLSDTAADSPIMREYLQEELLRIARETVERGEDIDIVAKAYRIPRSYLEGEALHSEG